MCWTWVLSMILILKKAQSKQEISPAMWPKCMEKTLNRMQNFSYVIHLLPCDEVATSVAVSGTLYGWSYWQTQSSDGWSLWNYLKAVGDVPLVSSETDIGTVGWVIEQCNCGTTLHIRHIGEIILTWDRFFFTEINMIWILFCTMFTLWRHKIVLSNTVRCKL